MLMWQHTAVVGSGGAAVGCEGTLSGRRQRSTASLWKELRRVFQGSGSGISWASLLSKMA